jgi:hypothetical protein
MGPIGHIGPIGYSYARSALQPPLGPFEDEDDDENEKTRLTRPLNSPSLLPRTTPCSGD